MSSVFKRNKISFKNAFFDVKSRILGVYWVVFRTYELCSEKMSKFAIDKMLLHWYNVIKEVQVLLKVLFLKESKNEAVK